MVSRFIDVSKQQRESPYTRHQEEKLAMLVKEFFFFDSLTPEESEQALNYFYDNINLLGFEKWHRVPVVSHSMHFVIFVWLVYFDETKVFSTRRAVEQLRPSMEEDGFLCFPFDFEVEEASII